MKNMIKIAALCLPLAALIFYSCQKEVSHNGNTISNEELGKPHAVTIFLTDHQTPVFDSVFIDIQKLEVKLEDDSIGNGGWISLDIRAGVYNILRFRNGLDTLFATGTLPNARIRKLRLTLGTRNSVVKDGQSFPLQVHDNDRQVVIDLDDNSFDINAAGQVEFTMDFDASGSIQIDNSGSGNNNGFRLKSHIKIFTHNNSGRIEGHVLPRAARPIITAISGVDTATAIPDDNDGEFKIVGLNAGTYKVIIDGQNGFSDTTINNVIVRNREDTHIAPITLHQ
jgi:hypothetical protein